MDRAKVAAQVEALFRDSSVRSIHAGWSNENTLYFNHSEPLMAVIQPEGGEGEVMWRLLIAQPIGGKILLSRKYPTLDAVIDGLVGIEYVATHPQRLLWFAARPISERAIEKMRI